MKSIAKKATSLLLIAYLIMLYTYIIPSHVHKDFLEDNKYILYQHDALVITVIQ